MIRILSHLDLYELKKVSHSGKKARDQYFPETKKKEKMSGSNGEPSQNQIHMLVRVMVSFDDFLSHLTIPPVHDSVYDPSTGYNHVTSSSIDIT